MLSGLNSWKIGVRLACRNDIYTSHGASENACLRTLGSGLRPALPAGVKPPETNELPVVL